MTAHTIPPLFGVLSARSNVAHRPKEGTAIFWTDACEEGEPRPPMQLAIPGSMIFEMALDGHGNLGIVVGFHTADGPQALGLSLEEAIEAVAWLGDTIARADSFGGGTRASAAVEGLARRLADSAAETAIFARRKIVQRKLAAPLLELVKTDLKAFYLEAERLAAAKIKDQVRLLAKAAAEPDRIEREAMLEEASAFVTEALELDRSALDRLMERVERVFADVA